MISASNSGAASTTLVLSRGNLGVPPVWTGRARNLCTQCVNSRKKTEMSWSCNPKIQGMAGMGMRLMHEAQGPAGGCLIVLRNSVEKSALTTTMGLNKSMGLKDHVAENRLVWTHTIFWFAKIAVWPLKFYPFWPCRIRQVISSQDQEMRNGEFLLRGMSPSMKAGFVPPEFENNAGMAYCNGSPISVGHIRYQTCAYIYIPYIYTYTHIHMLYICVYIYAHILLKNPCHNFPPPLAFDPQALGHGLEEVPHAPALRRPRVVLRDGAAHGDHTSVVQHVQHGFLGTAQQERHRDAKMQMDMHAEDCAIYIYIYILWLHLCASHGKQSSSILLSTFLAEHLH